MANKKEWSRKQIVKLIEQTAKKLDKHPTELKLAELLANEGISEWDLRKHGGHSSIAKAEFPVEGKDLRSLRNNAIATSYIGKLEKVAGDKLISKDEIRSIISSIVTPTKFPKVKALSKKGKLHREVVVMLNDTHYGLIVPKSEVGGVNEYDWKQACRRTAYLAQQVVDYKVEKRHEVEMLHVVLNGDMLNGAIHDLMGRTSYLLGVQQNGAIHILANFLNACAQHYKNITVHCTSGNHDDHPHRREGGRITSHKHDSVVTAVYFALSAIFKDNPNVNFNIPEGMYAEINLPAGRCLVTHGDTMFSRQLGNPGKSLNTEGLSVALNKYNTGEIDMGKKPFKLALFGHVHSHASFTSYDGTKVFIAPSLSGLDIYAKSLTINHNQTGQVIFESTPKYILGDVRLVKVDEADNMPELDKIIPVYNAGLKWQR